MNTKLKQHLDQVNIANAIVFPQPFYAVGFNELRLQCDEILKTCAPQPNSVVVMVTEEIVDVVSGMVDIGAELKLVARELRDAKVLEFAGRLNRLTVELNGALSFVLFLLSNLVDESS